MRSFSSSKSSPPSLERSQKSSSRRSIARAALTFSAGLAVASALSSGASAEPGTVYDRNLVVNGDAETGTTAGFVAMGGFAAIPHGADVGNRGFPTVGDPGVSEGGTSFYYGGQQAQSSGTQAIDLAEAAVDIDAGRVDYSLSALLGGYLSQDDNAVVRATFLGASGSILGTGLIGPVTPADREDLTGLFPREIGGSLPSGTRSASIEIDLSRFEGSDNDGYADNVSFVLSRAATAAVPEPATWATFILGFGLMGAAMRRRRPLVRTAREARTRRVDGR